MTIEQFQQNELLSAGLAEVLKNEVLQTAMEVLNAASPSNGGARMAEAVINQPHMAYIQLGLDRGYNIYPSLLRQLAVRPQKQEAQVEPTYENPEEKEDK